MYLALDAMNAPVHCGLRHTQSGCNLYQGEGTDPQVKHCPLFTGKIAHFAEVLAFRLGELGLDVQGLTPFYS